MNFTKTVAIGAFLATSLIAGGASAKAHDQGVKGSFADNGPGPAVTTTAAAAQTLGENRGNSTNAPGKNK